MSDVSSPSARLVYRFGDFELDPLTRRLSKNGGPVPLPEPQAAILTCLVTHAGDVVSKETLVESGWGGAAVSDDSLLKAVSRLRRTLDLPATTSTTAGARGIETVPGHGYRLTLPVVRVEPHVALPAGEELAPVRAFLEGRAALHTLRRDGFEPGRAGMEKLLRAHRDDVAGLVGLATANALVFEASRIDATCDMDALRQAIEYGRDATALAPRSGEAWSALAFALNLSGDVHQSAAAGYIAVALEPGDWIHWLRLAFVCWGEERLTAARKLLRLCPGVALAYWLIATVLIARGAFDTALDVLAEGCAAQDRQSIVEMKFPAVGLHLLRGLVLAARQDLRDAAAAFERELASLGLGHIYGPECAANTWYALGAIRLREGRHDAADAAFANALSVAPAHLFTAAALGRPVHALESGDPRLADAALATAAGLARAGRHLEAARGYRQAIDSKWLPSAGWLLPVEPLINAAARPDIWAEPLELVRRQAV